MKYATVEDIQARMVRTLTSDEQSVCCALLEDAGAVIDTYAPNASAEAKRVVSCRMVIRAVGDGTDGIPIGASQGSMSAIGYSQSWTLSTGGAVGELYLSRLERRMLGLGDKVGSYSPTQALVPKVGDLL